MDELLQSVGNLCSRESLAHRHVNCIHLLNTNDCASQLPHPHPRYPFLSAVKTGVLSHFLSYCLWLTGRNLQASNKGKCVRGQAPFPHSTYPF